MCVLCVTLNTSDIFCCICKEPTVCTYVDAQPPYFLSLICTDVAYMYTSVRTCMIFIMNQGTSWSPMRARLSLMASSNAS